MLIIFKFIFFGFIFEACAGYSLDCYESVERGRPISTEIDASYYARDEEECADRCDKVLFSCETFSYRYGTREANCLLSRTNYFSLRNNMIEDREFRMYSKRSNCRASSRNDDDRNSVGYWNNNSKCFRQVRSGIKIVDRYIDQVLRTRGVRECEEECIRSNRLTCRSFNFRIRDRTNYNSDNCELSSEDTYNLNINSRMDFVSDSDFEFYERIGFGRECDDNSGYSANNRWDDEDDIRYNDKCFSPFKRGYSLTRQASDESLYARSLSECESECKRSRYCRSFSFTERRYSSNMRYDDYNCYLTSKLEETIYSWDTNMDRDSDIFTEDRYCRGRGEDDSLMSDRPTLSNSNNDQDYFSGTNRNAYSVGGFRCMRGGCEIDRRHGNFWRCDIDENGSWDYCCRERERCGRSRNFESMDFSWCYVGSGDYDQWRPCKESSGDRYRSYLHENIPNITHQAAPPPWESEENNTTTPFLELLNLEDLQN